MRNYIVAFLLMSFLFACEQDDYEINNLSNEIIILGHGGMGIGQTYPMNSYESILRCLNIGTDGTELDVQMTKDSVLVAFHDSDLHDISDMKGTINDVNWSEIKDLHYLTTPYLPYPVLSLDQLFSNIDNLHDYVFTFDCKLYRSNTDDDLFFDTYVRAIVKIIDQYDLYDNVFIESQNEDVLKKLQQVNSEYKLFIYPSTFEDGLDIALGLGLYGITIATDKISTEQMDIAHENNMAVAIWNVHSHSANEEAIKKNPDFIQTDKVKDLVKLYK